MRTPLLQMFGVMFLIVLFLTCSPKTPTAPETGRVELDIQFPAAADSHTVAKNQEPGYTLMRIHIMITSSSGESVVAQDLSKSGSNFKGTFEVESGSGYTVSLDCYESSLLVFEGSRSNVSVSAGRTTTVTVSLSATLQSIQISPSNVTLYSGDTQQFSATANFSGTTTTVTSSATWSTSPGTAGSISSSGLFTASSSVTGTETVTVNYEGKQATASVAVNKSVTSVTISPTSVQLYNSETQQFTCTANYSDGSSASVTSSATWSTSPGTAGSISSSGLFTASSSATGSETVTVTYEGKQASSSVAVNKSVTSVSISPTNVQLNNSETKQFTCTANYSDGSSAAVTSSATWSTSPGTAGSISSSGLFTASSSATGTETVTATFEGKQASATVAINKSVASVSISPTSVQLYNSETKQFTCTANYSDGSSAAVTSSATWSTSPGTAGSISSSGLFTASSSATGSEAVTVTYEGKQALASVEISNTGLLIDQDGNVYTTIKIGDQVWMAENLRVTHYRNGDAIVLVTDGPEWASNDTYSQGSYCAYDNDINNIQIYGYLYNWAAVFDSRNIAPEGWHVPSDEDWKELEMYLGMSQEEADMVDYNRGTDEGGKLKQQGTVYWRSPNLGATDEKDFCALPAGYRAINNGEFEAMSSGALFWTSSSYYSESLGGGAWMRWLSYADANIGRDLYSFGYGMSIRLIRD